jgi:hypothetical protein
MANHEEKLNVKVLYIAALKPYEADVPRSETVGTLKTAVLDYFKLTEGGNKTYKLFLGKQELANMNETLGQVAGDKNTLALNLEEFIVQGV